MRALLFVVLFLAGAANAACIANCAKVASDVPVLSAAAPAPVATAGAASLSSDLITDLTAAQSLACAPVGDSVADPLGCACYPAVAAYVQKVSPASSTTLVGPISVFEAARLKVNTAEAGIPDELKAACGGLVMDVRLKILNIGSMLAAMGIRL